jgi:hypothetical protein
MSRPPDRNRNTRCRHDSGCRVNGIVTSLGETGCVGPFEIRDNGKVDVSQGINATCNAEEIIPKTRDLWKSLPTAVAAVIMTYLDFLEWTRMQRVSHRLSAIGTLGGAHPPSLALTNRKVNLLVGFSHSRWDIAPKSWVTVPRSPPDSALRMSITHLALGGACGRILLATKRLQEASVWQRSLHSLTIIMSYVTMPYNLSSLVHFERLTSLRLLREWASTSVDIGETTFIEGASKLVSTTTFTLPPLPCLPNLVHFEAQITCTQTQVDALSNAFPNLMTACTFLGRWSTRLDWTRLPALLEIEFTDDASRPPTPLPRCIERLRMSVGKHPQSVFEELFGDTGDTGYGASESTVLPVLENLGQYRHLRYLNLLVYTSNTFDPYKLLWNIPSLRHLTLTGAHIAPTPSRMKEITDPSATRDDTKHRIVSPLERLEIIGTLRISTIRYLPPLWFPNLQTFRVHAAECDTRPFHVPASLNVDMKIQRGFPPTRLPRQLLRTP